MDVKTANAVLNRQDRSVFKRLEGGHHMKSEVCKHWLSGRCYKIPCRFVHAELPGSTPKQSNSALLNVRRSVKSRTTWKNPSYYSPKNGSGCNNVGARDEHKSGEETKEKPLVRSVKKAQLCQHWVTGNCGHGNNCKFLHLWSSGNGFSMMAKLEGHSKAVSGVALPAGSDKLYSVSKDKSVRVWDCHSGQCASVCETNAEIGCLVSAGPWVFVGSPNTVKAGNIETQTELTLNAPVGQVYAMAVDNDTLFAGTEGSSILACKYSSVTNSLELAASLSGHSRAVLSLVVGANRLFSGSMDNTIRVWNLETLDCLQTLVGHTDAVMSVLCWDSFLLSGSLDNTVKVWAATESGNIEVFYEHKEETGVLALCGIHDAEAKPILLCSCKDDIVQLYDLPSFSERGRIFSKREVRVIQTGPGGIFFTGDATGQLLVWSIPGGSSDVAS